MSITNVAARGRQLDLDSFSRAAGMHPELVHRFVVLGLLEASGDAGRPTSLRFSADQLRVTGRIQRLRAAFCLNYASIGLVCDLLARIEELEAERRSGFARRPKPAEGE